MVDKKKLVVLAYLVVLVVLGVRVVPCILGNLLFQVGLRDLEVLDHLAFLEVLVVPLALEELEVVLEQHSTLANKLVHMLMDIPYHMD